MRINAQQKSMDIEPREINFIMDALMTQYLFGNKNVMPEVIVFPMYSIAKTRYGEVPVQYVPDVSEIAQDIIKDGEGVPEVTPAQEALLDEKDEEIKRLKAQVAEATGEQEPAPTPAPEDLIRQGEEAAMPDEPKAPPAPPPQPDRKPKMPPSGDIGPGAPPSDMHIRDPRDLARTAQALAEQPDIDEGKEKPFEKPIKRDEKGQPIVEDSPDA